MYVFAGRLKTLVRVLTEQLQPEVEAELALDSAVSSMLVVLAVLGIVMSL